MVFGLPAASCLVHIFDVLRIVKMCKFPIEAIGNSQDSVKNCTQPQILKRSSPHHEPRSRYLSDHDHVSYPTHEHDFRFYPALGAQTPVAGKEPLPYLPVESDSRLLWHVCAAH